MSCTFHHSRGGRSFDHMLTMCRGVGGLSARRRETRCGRARAGRFGLRVSQRAGRGWHEEWGALPAAEGRTAAQACCAPARVWDDGARWWAVVVLGGGWRWVVIRGGGCWWLLVMGVSGGAGGGGWWVVVLGWPVVQCGSVGPATTSAWAFPMCSKQVMYLASPDNQTS